MRILGPSDNAGNGMSQGVWGNCPVDELESGVSNLGWLYKEHFLNFGGLVTSNVKYASGWKTYEDSSGSILQLASEVGGVVRLATAASANNEQEMQAGGVNTGVMGKIYSTSPRKLWYESRVRISAITDISLFVGLAEEGCAVENTLADTTGELADKDMVGFRVILATPAYLDAVYQKTSGGVVAQKADAQTVVAATWYKLGMYYDANADLLKYFVNGVQVGSSLDVSAATSGTFPDGEELGPLFAIKTITGAVKNLDVDWVQMAQLY
jgi:hypothetical protein